MIKEILFLAPVFKQVIWGGARMGAEFHYQLPSDHIGECWGISAHPEGDCEIREGKYKGKKLSELWNEVPELFGHFDATGFPLLVKIIDAKQDCSVQVHPDDAYAGVHESGSLGKAECWYVMDCDEDASIIIGHNAKDKEQMKAMIEKGEWTEFLRELPVRKGDFIQIDPGTVHAIKGGLMILETQQSSDITYRLYDYDRLKDGKPRELHLDKGMAVITVPAKEVAESVKNVQDLPVNTLNELEANQYYKVWKLDVENAFTMTQDHPFMNMSVIAGEGTINGQKIQKGDHFILPFGFGKVELQGHMELIASVPRR